MVWCRVLAFLAIITFVYSDQSVGIKSGALDTLDNSLDLELNHILAKRDVKDPEKKSKEESKKGKKKGGVRNKRLEKKQKSKDKASKKIRRNKKKGISKK